LSADGVGTNEITRWTGKSKTCIWRWQERFVQEGYDGLLRDKTWPSRIPSLVPDISARVVMLTQSDPRALPAAARFATSLSENRTMEKPTEELSGVSRHRVLKGAHIAFKGHGATIGCTF
jgi:hypothetical protein